MIKKQSENNKICIKKVIWEKETEFLYFTKGKTYEVIDIENGWYRIVDDSGEDYLYPPEIFDKEFGVETDEYIKQLMIRC